MHESKVKQKCELDLLQNSNMATAKPGIQSQCHATKQ